MASEAAGRDLLSSPEAFPHLLSEGWGMTHKKSPGLVLPRH